MYCPKCGTKLEDGAGTCPNCGAKIKRNPPKQTEEEFPYEEDEGFLEDGDEEIVDEGVEDIADETDEEIVDETDEAFVDENDEEIVDENGEEIVDETNEEFVDESGEPSYQTEDEFDEDGAINYGDTSSETEQVPEEIKEQKEKDKKHTRISRPVFVVLFVVVSLLSLYVLYTLWDDEGEAERAGVDEEAGAGDTEESEEGETKAEDGEDTEADESGEDEEDANGEDIVIEQENPADDYELEAFEESWDVIQQYGMDGSELYYRDFVESVYKYSDLSFTLKSDTFEDLEDYYFVEATFSKPIMVPVDLKPGDTYTVDVDELRGTVLTLTCTGSSDDEDYLEGSNGQKYYCDGTGYDRMADLYESGGDRIEAPFYEGVLRIRLDAVTGDALTHGPYTHVTESDFDGGDLWFNIVAFDDKGYVKQLIIDGD